MIQMTREEAIGTIRNLISQVPVAMLTTTSVRGWLHSRPMIAQRLPFDGSLWFLTSRTAAKAADVRNRRQVNVTYASPERECYVSIAGVATIVDDREQIVKLWNPSYEPWFPQGPRDPELVLIRVDAEQAQYWDAAARKMGVVSDLMQARPVFHEMEPAVGK